MQTTAKPNEAAMATGGVPLPSFLERTEALVGAETLEVFRRSRVAIAGLGGVGGAILPTLVRLGVGRFSIADPGSFDAPDMNRQAAATRSTLGRNKAEVYEEFIRSVNPDADVKTFPQGVADDNIDDFLEGASLVIDALDLKVPSALRVKLAEQAWRQGIYNVTSPIIAFGTAVAVAAPGGMPMSEFLAIVERVRSRGKLPARFSEYFLPAHLDIMEHTMATRRMVPSNAIAVTVSSAVACTEIVMILGAGVMPGARKPVCLPKVLLVDLVRISYRVVDIEDFQ